jgi:hypothetical protein
MKFSANREEKKGPLGGTYYISRVTVQLTNEERTTAEKQNIMNCRLVGGKPDGEGQVFLEMCGQHTISMQDLLDGITIKANSGRELGILVTLEDQIREACKNFKANIEADILFASGGSSDTEEF